MKCDRRWWNDGRLARDGKWWQKRESFRCAGMGQYQHLTLLFYFFGDFVDSSYLLGPQLVVSIAAMDAAMEQWMFDRTKKMAGQYLSRQ